MAQSSITACNAALQARNELLNGGKIEIRTGNLQDIDGPVSGNLLETIPLNSQAFGQPVGRVAVANLPAAVVTVSAANNDPKHYVAYGKTGTVERSGTVGTANADMILSKGTWIPGEDLSITSWVTVEAK